MLKKTFVWVLIVSLLFSFSSGCANFTALPELAEGTIQISGNKVDNDYNNFLDIGGNLVRIDDKLYYNYEKNGRQYGTIEISSAGSKRIFWMGANWLYPEILPVIREYRGQLLMFYEDEPRVYSAEKGEFIVDETLKAIPDFNENFFVGNSGIFYTQKAEYMADSPLYCYDGQETFVVFSEDLDRKSLYPADDGIVFYSNTDDTVYKVLFDSLQVEEIASLTETETSHLLNGISFDYVMYNMAFFAFFSEDMYNLCSCDLETLEKKEIWTYSFKKEKPYFECAYKPYNNSVFIASEVGIYRSDLLTEQTEKLSDAYGCQCYIVDDTWLYYVGKEAELWRIPQAGGEPELVYG